MASWQRLSAQVEEQLQQLSIPAEHHAQITRLVAAELAPAQPARQTTSEQIQERRRRLARIYADGLIGEQAYSAEMAELNAQLAAEPETPASVSMDDIADAVSWLSKMPALYARANTTERAQLLQLLFTTLWVDEGQLTAITPRPLYLVVAGCFVRIATPGRDQRPIRTKLLPLWLPNRQAYVRIGR
jgi:ATP-dependent Clp protease ATP-binding subunit ClpA